MIGHTWTMTPKGLECIGCGFPDNNFRHDNDDVSIRINEDGIHVRGVDHDKDSTYEIKSKDVDINIDDKGVQIDAR